MRPYKADFGERLIDVLNRAVLEPPQVRKLIRFSEGLLAGA